MKSKAMLRSMWRARGNEMKAAIDEAFKNMERLPNGHYVFRSGPYLKPVAARWRNLARHARALGRRPSFPWPGS